MTNELRINLLGPMSLRRSGAQLDPGPLRQRALLAALALKPDGIWPADELLEAVWGDRLPNTGIKILPSYIYRLRRTLGDADQLEYTRGGYRLRVESDAVDVHEFAATVADGHVARAAGEQRTALSLYRSALALFCGEPLSGLPGDYLGAHRTHLVEQRDSVLHEQFTIAHELGLHADTVAELNTAVTARPLDERFIALLMCALAEVGRQGDALAVYTAARERLVEELGVDPGDRLRQAQEAVLAHPAGHVVVQAPKPTELPHLAGFVGRKKDLAEIRTLLHVARDSSEPAAGAPVVVIDGMAGVGKTALSVRAGQELAADYPDGQLFVDLHGYDPDRSPLSSEVVVTQLLISLGLPLATIPADIDARTARWRSEVFGRRLLLIFDNAATSRGLGPLLPATARCAVLVTSRRKLTGFEGAHRLTLQPLTAKDGEQLVTTMLGPQRASIDLTAVRQLVRRCGGLPLALRIAGARLQNRPSLSIQQFSDRLGQPGRRLAELSAEDRALAASFGLSYEQLLPPQRDLFCLLSATSGYDFDEYSAAAVIGLDPPTAAVLLDQLAEVNLMIEHRSGRYRYHDLLREHAIQVVRSSELQHQEHAASDRYLTYSLSVANEVVRAAFKTSCLPVPERASGRPAFRSTREALAWASIELENLSAAVRQAANSGFDEITWRLGIAVARLAYYFVRIQERDEILDLAMAAAQQAGSRDGQAAVFYTLGRLTKLQRGPAQSLRYLQEADRLLSDRTPAQLRAHVLSALAYALGRLEPDSEWAELYDQAFALLQKDPDESLLARTLAECAILHSDRLDYQMAASRYQEALEVAEKLADVQVQGEILNGLAECELELGRPESALLIATRAVALADELDITYSKVYSLCFVGRAQVALRSGDEALVNFRAALRLAVDASLYDAGDVIRLRMSEALISLGHLEEARTEYSRVQQAAIARERPVLTARALAGLASCDLAAGDCSAAITMLQRAIDFAARSNSAYADVLRGRLEQLTSTGP